MACKINTIDDLKKAMGLNTEAEVDAYFEDFYTRAQATYEATNSFDLAGMEDEFDKMIQSGKLGEIEKEEITRVREIMFAELKKRHGI